MGSSVCYSFSFCLMLTVVSGFAIGPTLRPDWYRFGGGLFPWLAESVQESDCILTEFIRMLEGMRTTGYVPKDRNGRVLGHSGVTIGGGVDLGSKSRSYFVQVSVPTYIIDKLEPYFGLKGQEAVRKLQEQPLYLTTNLLTDLVMIYKVNNVKNTYNANIGAGKLRFSQLTDAQKTVITSVLFQYGRSRRVPTFWRHVTNQDWEAAIRELRDFGDKYPTRRNKEADLLENDDGSKGACDQ